MNKVELLKAAATDFHRQLFSIAGKDREFDGMLEELKTLFARVAADKVKPQAEGVYHQRFRSEDAAHGREAPLFSAESAFVSALLDCRSKPWYPR